MSRRRRRRSIELVQTCCAPSPYGHTLYGRPLRYRTNANLSFTLYVMASLAVNGKSLGRVNTYTTSARAGMPSSTLLRHLRQLDHALLQLVTLLCLYVNWKVTNTGLVPRLVTNTSLVPMLVTNTSLVPMLVTNTSLVPRLVTNTSLVPRLVVLFPCL